MATYLDTLPHLGVGLTLKDSYLPDISDYLRLIDCLEVKPDDYIPDARRTVKLLHVLNEHLPLIAHGLALSIGSAEGVSKRHLSKLRTFFKHAPVMPWLGEHLGCSRAGGTEIPHFVNLPYTTDMLDLLVANIGQAKRALAVPLILENIPWEFAYPESEMEEAEFFARLVQRTGCGLLLDVTNLYANHVNFGWDIETYLRVYPVHCVVQIHFNGGYYDDDGRYVDSHSTPAPDEIWEIIREVMRRGAPLRALILERDDNAPLEAVASELIKAKQLLKEAKWD